jgi:hypothetical protein
MMMNEPVTFQMPQGPIIVISDGAVVRQFGDNFHAEDGVSMRPMEKASIMARLRTLADEIEKAEPR